MFMNVVTKNRQSESFLVILKLVNVMFFSFRFPLHLSLTPVFTASTLDPREGIFTCSPSSRSVRQDRLKLLFTMPWKLAKGHYLTLMHVFIKSHSSLS